MSLEDLVRILEKKPPTRVPGTAVFLTSTPHAAPTALMHSLKHYKVLHEHNVILTIETVNTPRVEAAERVRMKKLGETFAAAFRLHGNSQRAQSPRNRPQAGLDLRHHVHLIFSVATVAQAGRAFRHAALAG